MKMTQAGEETQTHVVLGQKYAYATISLILGISCFVNFLGMEKAILAIVFGWLALKTTPPPALRDRRLWAKTGLVLGTALLIFVPVIIILKFDELREVFEALRQLSNSK
jgi:hypothetical protein